MKTAGKRILSALVLVALMLTSVFALSSCNLSSFLPSSSSAVGIEKTEINDKGELIIYYSDGTKDNLGVIVGKDGKDGEDGEDGRDGSDTSVRVISADINALGELVLTYSDGETENLGVVVGKDGQDATEPPTIQNVQVTIENNGVSADVASTVAAALPSCVSVICNFTVGSTVSASAGSGVFYSLDKATGDAIVITNYHVVYSAKLARVADKIGINLYGSPFSSQTIAATFVGGSMEEDIAVLKITGSEALRTSIAQQAVIASSDALHPGDTAIAIGNPRGYGISATFGTVNVVTESLDTVACDDVTEITLRVMRIDTAVNSGNSGGGLFDGEGRLIGIVNAKSIEQNIENIGYALPIDKVADLVDNILYYCSDGTLQHPYKPKLGISIKIVDSSAVLDTDTGLYDIKETVEVIGIDEGSLAEGVFQLGDRFISVTVGGETLQISRIHQITESLLRIRPETAITFKVLRGGTEIDLTVTPPLNAYSPIK